MGKNVVRRTISGTGTFTVPAGVTRIVVRAVGPNITDANAVAPYLGNTTFALKAGGYPLMWGINTGGQLGDITITNRSSPIQVVGNYLFTSIAGGDEHTLAIDYSGAAYAWGLNTSNQLGDGTGTSRSSPVAVLGGNSFIMIRGSVTHSLALKSDGTAWAWGSNTRGELGDGTTVPKTSPVQVIGGHSFIAIAAGDSAYSVALKSDGTVWTWGRNGEGQLGDGTATSKSSPVQVVGGHSFISISAGGSLAGTGHTLALKSTGAAWAWGLNQYGGLGDGTTTSRSSPVAVIGGHSFIQVVANGRYHSLALKSDGTAWAWGYNINGQLGDGSVTSRSSPVAVAGGNSFTLLRAGENHSVGIKDVGTLFTWGLNSSGQLGDGTTTPRSSPVAVVGGYTFGGSGPAGQYFILSVSPNDTISYGTNYFGTVRTVASPFLIEYES